MSAESIEPEPDPMNRFIKEMGHCSAPGCDCRRTKYAVEELREDLKEMPVQLRSWEGERVQEYNRQPRAWLEPWPDDEPVIESDQGTGVPDSTEGTS